LIEDPTLRSDLAVSSPYAVYASVVLSRPPMLTPTLHRFEESFYFYQRRLDQRLALPFTRYFYFKKGTPTDLEWKRKQKEHADPYTGFGKEGWRDELLVGDDRYKEAGTYERLVKTTVTGEEGLEDAGIMERETEADRKKYRKSLDRAGEKTLYLLVKKDKGRWSFPEAKLMGKENLKQVSFWIWILDGAE
jgi:large subunit ribosomal protein L46